MPSIVQIAYEINHRAKTREIGQLQRIRGKLKHGRVFTDQTIKPRDDSGYAFHVGGRTELQFNIGFERAMGKRFRHLDDFDRLLPVYRFVEAAPSSHR